MTECSLQGGSFLEHDVVIAALFRYRVEMKKEAGRLAPSSMARIFTTRAETANTLYMAFGPASMRRESHD